MPLMRAASSPGEGESERSKEEELGLLVPSLATEWLLLRFSMSLNTNILSLRPLWNAILPPLACCCVTPDRVFAIRVPAVIVPFQPHIRFIRRLVVMCVRFLFCPLLTRLTSFRL